jgi:hypothetical protein
MRKILCAAIVLLLYVCLPGNADTFRITQFGTFDLGVTFSTITSVTLGWTGIPALGYEDLQNRATGLIERQPIDNCFCVNVSSENGFLLLSYSDSTCDHVLRTHGETVLSGGEWESLEYFTSIMHGKGTFMCNYANFLFPSPLTPSEDWTVIDQNMGYPLISGAYAEIVGTPGIPESDIPEPSSLFALLAGLGGISSLVVRRGSLLHIAPNTSPRARAN